MVLKATDEDDRRPTFEVAESGADAASTTLESLLEGVDTVLVAVPDSVGRLMGKRLPVESFRRVMSAGSLAMMDYFLVTWLENTAQTEFDVSGWHRGWGNCELVPDLSSFRRLPWDKSSAVVLCDTLLTDGERTPVAPRELLRRQTERAHALGITPVCAAELEFRLFDTSYRTAHEQGYRGLRRSHHKKQDNDLLHAGADETFIGLLRQQLPALGIGVELSQGEDGAGQHEITLSHCEMAEAADRTVLFKHAVKALAMRLEKSATFMAKWRSDETGSSGHVHLSLAGRDGTPLLWDNSQGLSNLGRSFLAGLIRYTPELMVLHAQYANSYRRLVEGSLAPTNTSWGWDNRTTCFRLVGRNRSFRIECRMPAADLNPYWSFAGLLAAGIAGIEEQLPLPPETKGNAYDDSSAHPLPRDLTEALALFEHSPLAAAALGEGVHRHLARLLSHELTGARCAISYWELERGFDAC